MAIALSDVRFWGQSGHWLNYRRHLPLVFMEMRLPIFCYRSIRGIAHLQAASEEV
jgi:hypothetical protein